MAEGKVKKPWYKRWWAITLYVIIGLSIIGNLLGGTDSSGTINTPSSGDFCRSIIPEKIKLLCHTTDNEVNTGRITCINSPNETYKWNDGIPITGTIWFEKGWRTGENVNYLYSVSYLGYKKESVSADGTIGEPISYRVMWTLDPNDETDAAGFKVKSYKCCQSTKYNSCDILGMSYNNW